MAMLAAACDSESKSLFSDDDLFTRTRSSSKIPMYVLRTSDSSDEENTSSCLGRSGQPLKKKRRKVSL